MDNGFNFKMDVDAVEVDNSTVHGQDPGIFNVSIESIHYGEKTQKDKDAIPCIDVELRINNVVLYHKEELNPADGAGKPITDRTKFDVGSQDEFNKKFSRVLHVITKAGIKKEDVAKIKFTDAKSLAEGLNKLLTADAKKAQFLYKVTGSVINGVMPYAAGSSFNEAAAPISEGMRFKPTEIQNNNAYYAKLAATPTAEADNGGAANNLGGPATGAAKPASKQLF